jgi:hypothetical protein
LKKLVIEWRHLDEEGNTCIRCSETGAALGVVVERLAEECRPEGWEIVFKESKLTKDEIASSNLILLNGIPIENVLPNGRGSESHCESCCDLSEMSRPAAGLSSMTDIPMRLFLSLLSGKLCAD